MEMLPGRGGSLPMTGDEGSFLYKKIELRESVDSRGGERDGSVKCIKRK